LRLYEDISGRPQNQSSGELTAFDVEAHSTGPNPYNSRDIDFIARNSMAVMLCLTHKISDRLEAPDGALDRPGNGIVNTAPGQRNRLNRQENLSLSSMQQ
jgi:hypothetical protein